MLWTEQSLQNWIPYKLIRNSNDLSCEWLYVGEGPFLEPSFDQTINRCKQLPENRDGEKHISSVSALFEWSEKVNAAEVAGFIFHISRCGSTMASQLLSLRSEHILLPEVPFFDDILRIQNRGIRKRQFIQSSPEILQPEKSRLRK